MKTRIERHLALLDYALAALARQKARALGLWLVYVALVFVLASVMLFTHALRQEMQRVLAHAPDVVVQRMVAGRVALITLDDVQRMGRIRGVQQVQPRLWGYYYDRLLKANYTFMAIAANAPAQGTVYIGPALARLRGLQAGDPLAFEDYAGRIAVFRVAQVLAQDSELASADLVLLCEADFRHFFAIAPGHYTDLALSVANALERRVVAGKVRAALPDARPVLREEMLRTYAAVFDWREGLVLSIFSGALLAFAILAWNKAAGLSAQERREIGILKATGWETGDVLAMKFWEGALLSLTAFLLGWLAAFVHVFVAGGALLRPVLQGWAVLYPRFALAPVADGVQLWSLLLFTVLPFVAATTVPAWRAAIADPDAVMRS